MANENQIKQKIVLEGEKEYKSALKDASRNLKTLKTEMKAETAELGKNATAQQKAEVQAKNLKKQIAEQEKIVKTCKEALEEVKEKYGDNADAVAKYEQQLNNARAALGNMRTQLESVGSSFDGVTTEASAGVVATKSLADAFSDLSNIGQGISDKIEGIFTGMVGTVRSAITEVWGEIMDLAARSNSWLDIAGFWNTNANEIQKWAHAAGYASASLEDINSLVTKINMVDSKKIAEITGISGENYSDKWKYAMAVMDSISGMTPEKKMEAAFEIFGKQGTKALDLVNDWQKVLDHLDEFDAENGGLGMSEEDMTTMADIYDKVNGMAEKWQAFKDSVEAGVLGKFTLDILGNAEGILDAFIAFFNAKNDQEREQALKDLETQMTEFFTRLGEAIAAAAEAMDKVGTELEGSENGIVSAAGTMLKTLADLLNWFTEEGNIDKVVGGFETLAAFWLVGKGFKMASAIAAVAANIETITKFKGIGGIGGDSTGGATGSVLGKIGGILSTTAAKVTGGVAAGLLTLFQNALTEQGNDDLDVDKNGNVIVKQTGELYQANTGEPMIIAEDITDADRAKTEPVYIEEDEDLDGEALLDLSQGQRNAAEDYWDAMKEALLGDGDLDLFRTLLEEQFDDDPVLLEKLDSLIDSLWDDNQQDLDDLPDWWFGANNQQGALTTAEIENAIQRGAANGVSNIIVTMDGRTVGKLIAPYVSEEIATWVY